MNFIARFVLWLPVICVLSLNSLVGATWYAAATGSDTNGTSSLPWSVPYALTNTAFLAAGDTVLFKSGTFDCTAYYSAYDSSNAVMVTRSGTASDKITFQSESLWGFTFNGGVIVPYSTSNLVFKYLRFNFAGTSRVRTNIYEYPTMLNAFGSNVVPYHCIMENGAIGLGYWQLASGKEVHGNIIRFNGLQDWTPAYNGAIRGPGIYTENQNGTAIFEGNIIYGNITEGMLIAQEMEGYKLTNNVLVGGFGASLLFETRNNPSSGINVVSNAVWSQHASGVQLGYIDPDSINSFNAHVLGNVIVGRLKGLKVDNRWTSATIRTNQIVKYGAHGDGESAFAEEYNVVQLETYNQTNSPVYSILGNDYYSSVNSVNNFAYWGTNMSFANWQTYSGDAGSTVTTTLPTANVVRIFRPSSDARFVHVVVYNWQTNATASVSLSPYFSSGSRLSVYDAQNIPNAYTNFTYGGGSLTLDLGLTNRAAMNGEFAGLPWAGFDPRFRAFVIYNSGETTVNAVTVNIGGL